MRRLGDVYEFKEERDRELLQTFHLNLMRRGAIKLSECVKRTVMSPSSRFWVSKERATLVMYSMLRGKSNEGMSLTRQEMYREIYRRLLLLKQEHPDWSVSQLTEVVVRQPAPRFYLTPKSALVILCKVRKQWAGLKPRLYR